MSKTPNNKPNNSVHPAAVIAVIIGFLLWLGWYIIQLNSTPFSRQVDKDTKEFLEKNPQFK